MNIFKHKKVSDYSKLSERRKKKIILQAAKKANEDQLNLMNKYSKIYRKTKTT